MSAYDIGYGFAAVLWPFFKRRQRLSVANILGAGITSNLGEARRMAKVAWCHMAGHILEAMFVPKHITKDNWREHLDFSEANAEAIRLLLDTPNTPVILVSAHHGVWEAATNVISFARPMIAIARTLNNRLVARFMKKYHFRGPVTIIDKNHGFSADVLRKWRQEGAAMTILMDQHTSHGLPLKFLGRPAMTHTSAARLAIRTGLPILIGSFVRVAPYRYRMVSGTPIWFERNTDLSQATQLLNDRLGEAVRKYPEQYLWAHRRWRIDIDKAIAV